MSETYRPVPGFDGYEVSDCGRVVSLKRGKRRELAVQVVDGGYRRVELWNGGWRTCFSIHTLVLMAFFGPRPHGQEGRHLDGDPANNRADNLAWGTPKENQADRVRHGTSNRGGRHGCAKLTEGDVLAILAGELGSPKEAALKLGVSPGAVYGVLSGDTWKHLTGAG